MKVELIVAVVLTSLSIGERQQRSTVLTDESKRILEHFDFSNFDKQEALNYIDRQRYENQIRGKRSHSRSKKDQNEKAQGLVDTRDELFKDNSKRSLNPDLKFQLVERRNSARRMDNGWHYGEPVSTARNRLIAIARMKRGHHSRKKHRPKSSLYESDIDFDDNKKYEKKEKKRHRKRKRKRKKKRHYWDQWSDWTPCSVTCGRGRKIRWRKCIAKNCAFGEFEMGEKTCQLPACNLLSKLLGL